MLDAQKMAYYLCITSDLTRDLSCKFFHQEPIRLKIHFYSFLDERRVQEVTILSHL